MVSGLLFSRKQRGVDRRHFAAFVGFTAAVVAVTATTFELLVTDFYPHSMSRAWGEFLFATCIIVTFSIPITFLAGLLSRGTQRVALVSGGIVVALMYISGLVSRFGYWGFPRR
jgi:hypothetical protein